MDNKNDSDKLAKKTSAFNSAKADLGSHSGEKPAYTMAGRSQKASPPQPALTGMNPITRQPKTTPYA